MSGAQNQLSLDTPQMLYLVGNPQISFFKAVYRRHTNFAIEELSETPNTTLTRSTNGKLTTEFTLSKSGSLIHKMYLDIKLGSVGISGSPSYANWTNNTGHAFINSIKFKIGGFTIEEHTDVALDVYNELTDHEEREHLGLNKHNAKRAYLTSGSDTSKLREVRLQVPLKFWFNRNIGLALPLCALSNSEVKVTCEFKDVKTLINVGTGGAVGDISNDTVQEVNLVSQYIILDTEEETKFKQSAHEYLIEQIQCINPIDISSSTEIKIENLKNPVKEVFWVFRHNVAGTEQVPSVVNPSNALDNTHYVNDNDSTTDLARGPNWTNNNDYFNYMYGGEGNSGSANILTGGQKQDNRINSGIGMYGNVSASLEHFEELKIVVNNAERGFFRPATYYRTTVPQMIGHRVPRKHVYCYSFSINPEEYQPSGTCDMTGSDNFILRFKKAFDSGQQRKLHLFAVNYNIFRVIGGRGGLAFSN